MKVREFNEFYNRKRGDKHTLIKKPDMQKGEITVFLSLLFILIMAFIGAIIESASIQVAKNTKRGDADSALCSVFAEYQKVLLEEYDIFGLEGTYETGKFTNKLISDRLDYYGGGAMEHHIIKLQFLTDHRGEGLREQMIRYIENKANLDSLGKVEQSVPMWQEQSIQGEVTRNTEEVINQNLQLEMKEAECGLSEEMNPLTNVEHLKQSSLLQLVFPKSQALSNKQIIQAKFPSGRGLQQGYGSFPVRQGTKGTGANVFVGAYMLEHFSSVIDEQKAGVLSYELEYLLEGKERDEENLEAVVKKLILLRTGANYTYLLLDGEKQMEAGALALTISSMLALPPLTEAVKQAILAAWAFGESIMDMRSLLAAKRVPLVKTRDSWQLQLDDLLTLGTETDVQEGEDFEEGQNYKEYLRMLLFLENQEVCVGRSMDLIEGNLREVHGLGFFRMDHCISKMEIQHRSKITSGITYEFNNRYGYR